METALTRITEVEDPVLKKNPETVMPESYWVWDCPNQRYHHRCCGDPKWAYGENFRCRACDAPTPDSFTFEDLEKFIRANGLGNDEHFGIEHHDWKTGQRIDDRRREQIYTPGVRWIAVWWVVGGSEGYWVHVARIIPSDGPENPAAEQIALGKGWSIEWAERSVRLLQKYINTRNQ